MRDTITDYVTFDLNHPESIEEQPEESRKLSFGWLSLTLAPRMRKTDPAMEPETLPDEKETKHDLPKK